MLLGGTGQDGWAVGLNEEQEDGAEVWKGDEELPGPSRQAWGGEMPDLVVLGA